MGGKAVMKSARSKVSKALTEKQLDNEEARKKLLQDKFLSQAKDLSATNKETSITVESGNSNIDTTIRKSTGINKSGNNDKRVKELSSKVIEQKKAIISLRNSKQELNNELTSTKTELKDCTKSNNKKDERINELLKELDITKSEVNRQKDTINSLKSNCKSSNDKNKHQLTVIKDRDKTIIKYMRQIEDLMHGDVKEQCTKCNRVESLLNEIDVLRGTLGENKKKYNKEIASLISRLRIRRARSSSIRRPLLYKPVQDASLITGVLKRSGDFNMYFESSTGERFNIVGATNGVVSGTPCAVALVGNKGVTIKKIYPIDQQVPTSATTKSVNTKSSNKTNNDTLYFTTPYKVLVISSKNKDKYQRCLENAGLDVSWFDSSVANEARLRGMSDRHDMVICCSAHSESYAVRLMRELIEESGTPLKYNIVSQDSEQNLLARVNYVVENSK